MKPRTLILLSLISIALLALAVFAYSQRSTEFAAPTPERLYGGLIERVDDIAEIHIDGPRGPFHVDLDGDQWRMRENGGYPIRTEKIREAVVSLSDLRVLEPKTSRPENYHMIGVQDPGPGADSILVEMKTKDGEDIVSVILGFIEHDATRTQPRRRYVRLTDDPRSYYIDGVAEVEMDPMRWIDREILRVLRSWTHDVVITHPDGETLRIYKPTVEALDFSIADKPEGTEFIDERDVNLVGGSFIYIGMEDVRPRDTLDPSKVVPGPVATVRTFDGFVLTATLFDYEGETWATFEASVGEPVVDIEEVNAELESSSSGRSLATLRPIEEVEAAVEDMNERLANWRFKMTENKTRLLAFRMTDLVQQPGENRVSPIQPTQGP